MKCKCIKNYNNEVKVKAVNGEDKTLKISFRKGEFYAASKTRDHAVFVIKDNASTHKIAFKDEDYKLLFRTL